MKKGSHHSEESKQHLSNLLKGKKGHPNWAKGLTKETDPRLKTAGEKAKGRRPRLGAVLSEETKKKISNSLKNKPRTTPIWNKGLTKETDPRILKISFPKKPETRKKLSEAQRGVPNNFPNWNKGLTMETDPRIKVMTAKAIKSKTGKHHSLEWCRHISEGNKGKVLSETHLKHIRDRWKNPDFIKNFQKGIHYKPTKPELKTQQIIEELKIPFKYTGDFSKNIDGKFPDFYSEDRKAVIEVFGDYWHDESEVETRIQFFKERGYDCLVLWEHEIKNNQIQEKLLSFSEGLI